VRVPRCLIVQHAPAEEPYLLAEALAARRVELEVHAVPAGPPLPADAAGVDGLVVMGGPMSARSDDGFPTRRAELGLLADAVRRGVPTLGVCLGAQLLAAAAGGAVRDGQGAEIGWGPVELAAPAGEDRLLRGAARRLTVLHWHGETFDLPPGAVLLAGNHRYRHQAFRLGERAWGLQFHVEVDEAAVRRFVADFGAEAAAAGTDPAGITAAAPRHLRALSDPSAWSGLVLAGRFADLVAEGWASPAAT
jgi:GMP synthase-like glutamine amidotransferase